MARETCNICRVGGCNAFVSEGARLGSIGSDDLARVSAVASLGSFGGEVCPRALAAFAHVERATNSGDGATMCGL